MKVEKFPNCTGVVCLSDEYVLMCATCRLFTCTSMHVSVLCTVKSLHSSVGTLSSCSCGIAKNSVVDVL